MAYKGSAPAVADTFVASSASVIGNVKIGTDSAVWYGAVVRGDVNSVTLGDGVAVLDRAVLHCSGGGPKDAPLRVGNNVTIKAGAIVHGCTLADGVVVGEGAQVLDGAKVGRGAYIAPGAILQENTDVPAGQVWGGVPAAYVRDVSAAETEAFVAEVAENIELARTHAAEDAKSFEQIEDDLYNYEQEAGRSEYYFQRLTPDQMQFKLGEVENHDVPGRVLDSAISGRTHKEPRPHGSGGLA